ncbi:MAG: hypothetical protein KA059_00975 [Elusimicrobiales bacterium]|nr:hypothetical protein [Elusimicrobiales bacterium]
MNSFKLLLAAILSLILSSSFSNSFNDYPTLISLGKLVKDPVENVISISSGLRDIYSDINYIRLLEYYGTPEEGSENVEYGDGKYPAFYPMSLDIVIENPYYTNAVMTSAGVLGFNLDEVYKAISILKFALIYDRNNYKYITLLSALMIKQSRKKIYDDKLLSDLYNISFEENTPVVIRQASAFLHKEAKKYDRALKLYELIIKTSKEKSYTDNAERQIKLIRERYEVN